MEAADRPPPGDAPAKPARALGTPLASTIAVVTTILGLIVLAWTILFVTKGRFLKPTFEKIVAAQTHRDVKVAGDFQLYFAPFNVKFLAEGLTVSNPEWAGRGNFFSARKIDTRISTWSLITGNRRINWLGLEDGHLDLQWDKDGKRNTWTFDENKEKGDAARVADHPPRARPGNAGPLRRSADAGRSRHSDPHRRGAGHQVRLFDPLRRQRHRAGHALHPRRRAAHPQCHRRGRQNQLKLHVEGVRTQIDVSGTLPGATEIEGADLHMDARGQNLADVFAWPGSRCPTRALSPALGADQARRRMALHRPHRPFRRSDLAGKFTVAMKEPRLLLTADLTRACSTSSMPARSSATARRLGRRARW
jgi:hypothetical protein